MSLSFDIRMADVDFARMDVCESEHWQTRLHFNQSYLGRCLVIAKRVSDTSLATCSDEEYHDLRCVLQRYERVVGAAFQPARFNYTQLGNEWPQLHVHAIPRYDTPRQWKHYAISDTRYHQNPSPKPPPPVPLEEAYAIAAHLRALFAADGDAVGRLPLENAAKAS
ncbi:HIT family protein [Ciceribacter thiooxidans]|uniref:HIT family protein n=1 Tax=Ciceribacter thiooxidans TaxID=1969821 RepID=A0ABV7HZ76_9HYPH|nr:HIT domain-containing protein [Ciceribacter thiooxidans]